jgi:hypothetical protein
MYHSEESAAMLRHSLFFITPGWTTYGKSKVIYGTFYWFYKAAYEGENILLL